MGEKIGRALEVLTAQEWEGLPHLYLPPEGYGRQDLK